MKTQIEAEDGKQEIFIRRAFDLPINLLFKAYTVPELIEQWMGNKVLIHESKNHGSYRFETRSPNGNLLFSANGVIHSFEQGKAIVRTFEMENTPYSPQLEYLSFEELEEGKSTLVIHVLYRSVKERDEILKLPFTYGINMAHDRLEETMKQHIK